MSEIISTNKLLSLLRKEKIGTWFDLGLFIDRFREKDEIEDRGVIMGFDDFCNRHKSGGLGFVTFHYMVDGVTVEIGKQARLFEKNLPGMPIHYIGGVFRNKSETLISQHYKTHTINELKGFSEWNLYQDLFLTTLERGSKKYNELIIQLWDQTLRIIDKLGKYIEKEGISLLYVVNVCSNPGNVAAALALVILSEYKRIPVINNNHDFYFEGGNSKFDRKSKGLRKGPRDFFFTNAHLGEVFSLIEMLYPWDSKYWLNVNINRSQTDFLIRYKGHNPARVLEIGTAVDTTIYTNKDKRRNINAFLQFENVLARYKTRLISYSVEDVENNELVSEKNPKPILIGNKTRPVEKFIAENIIFLQPTRIISRKRIELGFALLRRLIENQEIRNRFLTTPNLKITILISGPIADGHYDYYRKVIGRFRQLLNELPQEFRHRIFLALLLGELDKEAFISRFKEPIGISDLYNIASLILLPSKTEGRGLPIIEATACGTPIFCRRYEPEVVYSEVIGEHLGEQDRLKVYEFRGKKITKKMAGQIVERIFFPHKFAEETRHNKRIVEKRYSLEALNKNISQIIQILYTQTLPEEHERRLADDALRRYGEMVAFSNEDLDFLIHKAHRQYLPGYGRLSFMLMLKSLIDPSYFRIEQQKTRGSLFYFAREIISEYSGTTTLSAEKISLFYNSVYHLFHVMEAEVSIRHDHSMAYRHRNRNNYLYQKYTFQELTGVVNLLYQSVICPDPRVKVDVSPQFFTDWNLALLQLSTSNYLAIDNREELIKKLQSNIPIAYFPGEFIMYELEFFALQAIRSRLHLTLEEELTSDLILEKKEEIQPVYIFAQEKKIGKQLDRKEIEKFIATGFSRELRLLYEFALVRIVTTRQLCVGIHFPQLGEEALAVLRKIREQGGFLLTNRRHAAMMTDIVNIDRFHIGRVRGSLSANIMGIPEESGYIQYVPAGLRATLAYPTPVQTARDLDNALHGETYQLLKEQTGEETIARALVEDAERRGSPVMHVLENLLKEKEETGPLQYSYITGIYEDGNPYNGVFARINLHADSWKFSTVSTRDDPVTVAEFVQDFEKKTGKQARLAWNGGYILNPELVGKLGLPESYIGSPLGLLIQEGTCLCPPLFNKAALLIDRQGRAEIRRVNCRNGIVLNFGEKKIVFSGKQYNMDDPGDAPAYYDLMYPQETIPGNGRTVVRLSGRTIKEIIVTGKGQEIGVIPVGLTLSFPPGHVPEMLQVNQEIAIIIPGFENILHAVEAGPMLLDEGQWSIDMQAEGWKTPNSIATQAARLDYLDMRGPKIAVGMNEQGELMVLTVNGRIRESVGATHSDMAGILARHGMVRAMGFDPGGSSTLFADGRILNISPYNRAYELNNYALPPQPRAVSNAVIGYL